MAASRLLLFGVGLLLPSALSLSTTELHGSGTTNPSKLIWKGMAILEEQSAAPIRMTYRGIGSSGLFFVCQICLLSAEDYVHLFPLVFPTLPGGPPPNPVEGALLLKV